MTALQRRRVAVVLSLLATVAAGISVVSTFGLADLPWGGAAAVSTWPLLTAAWLALPEASLPRRRRPRPTPSTPARP